MGTPESMHIIDVISSLPTHVMDNIFVRLPLPDAVRTSVLSKEWRYKWTFTPELDFDDRFFRWIYDRELHLNNRIKSSNQKLEKIIYQTLLCHQGPINKFALNAYDHQTSPDVDHWILFLSKCEVRDFTLFLKLKGNKHLMASHFFTFKHLTRLSLRACVFKPPPDFKGFSKLVFLDFRHVEFEPANFARFISQCLLLERVELTDCGKWDSVEVEGRRGKWDSIEVEGPNLRCFWFHGTFKSISIKNAPLLAQVSLILRTRDKSECQSSIKSLGFMPMLESLYLDTFALELLGAGGVPYRFPDSFNSLSVFQLSMNFISIEEVACALCIIRSSPNLEILNFWSRSNRNICKAVPEFIRAQKTPDRYLNQLRLVVIKLFSVDEAQMEFIRYLLASAGELEEMVIECVLILHYLMMSY